MKELNGTILKRLREENGYSQSQVAQYLNVDQSYLSKIESGERTIGLNYIQELSDLYGIDLENSNLENSNQPILLAYRANNVSVDDLKTIAKIKRLALNLRNMEELNNEE